MEPFGSKSSLLIGCLVEPGNTYDSKESVEDASSTVTEVDGAPEESGRVDRRQQIIVILTAFVAVFQTSGREPLRMDSMVEVSLTRF